MPIEIIAEISGNHGGKLENALKLIQHAAEAGATGVKFQTFEPLRLTMRRAVHPRLKASYTPDQLHTLYDTIYTPHDWFPALIDRAKVLGLTWHASVFDPEDVAFLETLDCPRYKISSFETWDAPDVHRAVFETRKPAVVSIHQANEHTTPPAWRDDWLVLHATDYAVAAKDANLAKLRMFPGYIKWGLSDHTTDEMAATVATILGASMIEWHIKLREVSTPDDAFSWTLTGFEHLARLVRKIERAMDGTGTT